MDTPAFNPGVAAEGDSRFSKLILNRNDELESSMIQQADMIFIDGDHSYEQVKRDTAIARAALRDGEGVLAWHDYLCDTVKWYIDDHNKKQRICLVSGTSMCFEIVKKRKKGIINDESWNGSEEGDWQEEGS
jgi:hypothetical protein